MSINRWMDKQCGTANKEILFSNEKERTSNACYDIFEDEPPKPYAK